MIQKRTVEVITSKGLTKDLTIKVSILNGSKYFSFDGLQHYLVFDLIIRNSVSSGFSTGTETKGNNKFTSWKSTEMTKGKIINPYELDTNFFSEYKSSNVKKQYLKKSV